MLQGDRVVARFILLALDFDLYTADVSISITQFTHKCAQDYAWGMCYHCNYKRIINQFISQLCNSKTMKCNEMIKHSDRPPEKQRSSKLVPK